MIIAVVPLSWTKLVYNRFHYKEESELNTFSMSRFQVLSYIDVLIYTNGVEHKLN